MAKALALVRTLFQNGKAPFSRFWIVMPQPLPLTVRLSSLLPGATAPAMFPGMIKRVLPGLRLPGLGVRRLSLFLILLLGCLSLLGTPIAWAGLNDDRFDGDIFALYAGNGSLVPPKISLAEALTRERPALMVLYADDSSDCKQFSTVVSQVQAFYGRAIEILPVRADAIPVLPSYAPNEPGYYFTGVVPQTVLFDAQGKVALNEGGAVPYEKLDDRLRQLFDLLPRTESVALKRRQLNELTTELRN
jgi:hypothetical protein